MMAAKIQYSTVGFHLMKLSSCSHRVAPPNSTMMPRLTHIMVSTLWPRSLTQPICPKLATMATRVAR